ncbi:hypothetical protein TUN199_11554 [Pyrenophora tritici-repentis]|nr:hypothetical protein PtrV1_12565 [Pyrenophora tritici-repentis]KAF7445377.1 hypothetical protein A1F99_103630 [Pyrenophora tritici-repentis]KAI0569479.1 hypothetical protein Alg130_11629 [Pyrenophora tritici-repentis]KAI0573641.1 hypothetical protein Alg215_09080 [Pyrenophora tritici-repentis]KAI0604195.1 hypothetical protein TUN205_11559 [Pyrenophora tritici-repentis]
MSRGHQRRKRRKQQPQPSNSAAPDDDTADYVHTMLGNRFVLTLANHARSSYEDKNQAVAVEDPNPMLGNHRVRAPKNATYTSTSTNSISTTTNMLDNRSGGLQNHRRKQSQQPSIGHSPALGHPSTTGNDCTMKAIVARNAGPNWTNIKNPIPLSEFKQVQPSSMIWEVTAEKTTNSSAHATHKDYLPTPDGLYCLKTAPFVVGIIDADTLSFRDRRMTSYAGKGDKFLIQE